MDFLKMMKQAKEMQEQMGSLQEQIIDIEVEGVAGAGLVKVTLNGKSDLKGLKIDPSLLKEDEGENLDDLNMAAPTDARARVEMAIQEKTQELMGGLGLPAGMKLPF